MFEPERPVLTPGDRDALSDEVVDGLRRAYDIGDWLDWPRTPKGSANTSFFVTASSGTYVLRRSAARKSLAAMKFEVELIDYLRESGYPAPELVLTRRGEKYGEHDGTLYLMTVFIAGGAYDQERVEHLRAAGRGLGLYHRLVGEFPGPLRQRPSRPLLALGPTGVGSLAEAERLAGRFLDVDERTRLRDALSYIRSEFARVHQELAEIYPALSTVIIHGSFGRSALIFERDALVGVVDYDRAAYEIRGLDLAYTVKAFCRVHDEQSVDHRVGFEYSRCRELLAAYREVEPLSPEDGQALPLLFRGQRLLKVRTKCENFSTKNALVPQEAKDARKLATMAEREATRLRWLERHSDVVLGALMA